MSTVVISCNRIKINTLEITNLKGEIVRIVEYECLSEKINNQWTVGEKYNNTYESFYNEDGYLTKYNLKKKTKHEKLLNMQ